MNPDIMYPALALTSSTFHPDADPETSSVDGITRSATGVTTRETWANIRAGTGNSTQYAFPSLDNLLFRIQHQEGDGNTAGWRAIDRFHASFDTSAITDSDTINSATISIWPADAPLDQLSHNGAIVVAESTITSDTNIVAGDWGSFNTTEFTSSRTALSGITNGQYNTYQDCQAACNVEWCCLQGGNTPCHPVSNPLQCDFGTTYPTQLDCFNNCGGAGGWECQMPPGGGAVHLGRYRPVRIR